MANRKKPEKARSVKNQSKRLRNAMIWLVRGFTLYDPRKRYKEISLSPQQSYVLWVLNEEPEISPGEIAKRLNLEKSHLTKIVKSLIDQGTIEKHQDTKDRRKLVLALTDKGKRIVKDLDKVSVESYIPLMEKVPKEERENVIRATEIMLKAMNDLRKEILAED